MTIVGERGAVGKQLRALLPSCTAFSDSFAGIDLAFFCVPSETAKELIPKARKEGTICIDASSAYRKDPSVPLIIPEINGTLLEKRPGIIASPNCTTTLMLLPLAPLHKEWGIKRIVVSTYQAVSGAGKKGIEELELQTRAALADEERAPECFPVSCAFNVFLHEAADEEEEKMALETKKILDDKKIGVVARCVRVPVIRVHSQAVNVEFSSPVDLQRAKELIRSAPGVQHQDNATPLDASGQKPVFCGDIRLDSTQKNTLELWIVGDQLLKGAALNMVQIAECLK